MSRSPAQVLEYLLSLDPDGDSLPDASMVSQGAMWPVWLMPLADEISRFEALAEAMLPEVSPREAVYMLGDYERVLGPDPYGRDATALTLAQRQALAYSRWTQKWGGRPADFIAFAATFGVTITIDEYQLTTCDEGCIGDTLTCNPTQFCWVVNMPAVLVEYATVDASEIGDCLDSFPPSLVQPAIAGRAPAHTNVVFNYSS
jgi:uncharacterized protein YmfQ (DUF2313 family)